MDKPETANLAEGRRVFVAPASRRRVFIQAAHRKNRRRDAGATKSRRKSRWGARNALRAVYTADPGKSKGPLLRLNNDIVSPLETIVVILIHRDAFDPPSAAPRRNHQAAAARQTIRGEFPHNSSGNTNGA